MSSKKRILCLFFFLTMILGMFAFIKIDSCAAEPVGEVTFSVEKFTIGQGYLIEPTQVAIREGQSVGEVLINILNESGYEPEMDSGKEFYLSGILKADSGVYRVPAIISTMGDMVDANGNGLTHPTGKEINIVYPDLCEFSYMSCSGWMYTVNGEFPSMTMNAYKLKDGDIVRIQFSLYGYGGDLGEKYADNPYVDIPDRNPLTRRLALMRKYKDICDSKGYSSTYEDAYAAAINMDISKTRFNAALNALPSEEDIIYWGNQKDAADVVLKINAIGTITLDKEGAIISARKAYDALNFAAKAMVSPEAITLLQKAETTLAQLKKEKAEKEEAERKAAEEQALRKKYTPSKVVIKALKPGKKTVKVTWKKVKNTTGYQVFMSKKKASGYKKIATIKKAKTVTFTKKKLTSKKTYYFRVRAYKTVGKKIYYGEYSATKRAKVK